MVFIFRKFLKPVISIAFFLTAFDVHAQVSLVQNVIDKLEGYKNFSYQFINRRKDFTIDTTVKQNKEVFLKAPGDTIFGYLFRLETIHKTENFSTTDIYNGKNLVFINPKDRTYEIQKTRSTDLSGTLLDNLHWIKGFVQKRPARLFKAADTIINGSGNTHLIVTTYDTVINKEHYYTLKHLFIDKQSGVPSAIISRSKNKNYGDGISDYYDEIRYYDYQFDRKNIDIATFNIPKGYQLRKEKAAPSALLTPGTIAPNWTLYTADGKRTSLIQLKGKVVLLDFYFIGCIPCMNAIKPLNNLYTKYKDKNVLIASITGRDKGKSVLAFEKQYGIKYTGYIGGADVVRSYHVESFPTFYLIDKEGKIGKVFVGFGDDFEDKIDSALDETLKK